MADDRDSINAEIAKLATDEGKLRRQFEEGYISRSIFQDTLAQIERRRRILIILRNETEVAGVLPNTTTVPHRRLGGSIVYGPSFYNQYPRK